MTPDFETKQEYDLVRAIDRSGLSSEHRLILSVNDLNESPSEVIVTSFQFDEGLLGSTVAQLSSDDPDYNDSITFSFTLIKTTIVYFFRSMVIVSIFCLLLTLKVSLPISFI